MTEVEKRVEERRRQARLDGGFVVAHTGREPWLRISEPPSGVVTSKQEQAIRDWAQFYYGYKDLRGLNAYMRGQGWDYYDILKEMYR